MLGGYDSPTPSPKKKKKNLGTDSAATVFNIVLTPTMNLFYLFNVTLCAFLSR